MLHIGSETLHAFNGLLTFNGDHLRQKQLYTVRSAAAEMALTTLRADKHARPGQAKTLGRCLMGLQLIFSCCLFAWHNKPPTTKLNSIQNECHSISYDIIHVFPNQWKKILFFFILIEIFFIVDLIFVISFFDDLVCSQVSLVFRDLFRIRRHQHAHDTAFHRRSLLDRCDII